MLTAQEPITLLSDESFVHGRFVSFGAILLPTPLLPQADALLQSYCQRHGLGAREMSFKKCSAGEANRYVGFVEKFWDLRERGIPVDFRAMVIDTRRNPLKAPEYGCETDEAGFYRMYHQFITCSVGKVAPGATHYELVVARTDDSYAHRNEILGKTVSGALRQRLGARFGVCGLTRDDPARSRTHQLADVMLGAVTHAYNPSGSATSCRSGNESRHASVVRSIPTSCRGSGRSTCGTSRRAAGRGGRSDHAVRSDPSPIERVPGSIEGTTPVTDRAHRPLK